MIKFSKQLSLGASGVVLNFLNTSNWQSQTNTKTKTKSDHLENPGKPAAQSLGLYFMTFLQEGADKRALVIIDVSCVTNLQSHYFRHRWCRHQAADWGIYGQILSPTLIYFSALPPVGQRLKHLEGSLMVQWGFKFTRRLNLTWCIFPIFGSKFGPKLSKEDSPDVPDTLSHATTNVWGCEDKTNFNTNLLVCTSSQRTLLHVHYRQYNILQQFPGAWYIVYVWMVDDRKQQRRRFAAHLMMIDRCGICAHWGWRHL